MIIYSIFRKHINFNSPSLILSLNLDSVQEPSGEIIEPPECLFEWQDYLMEAPIPLFKSLPPRNAYIKLAVTKVQAELMIKALKQDALSFSFCREVFVNCKVRVHYIFSSLFTT